MGGNSPVSTPRFYLGFVKPERLLWVRVENASWCTAADAFLDGATAAAELARSSIETR
jgi:hypothetical protein